MNQLTGRCVNVVLAVEEGKGLDFVKFPLHITAIFNGRALDSDTATPEDCPAFNTELVWEIEKKDLRKIRSSNQPLRVELITTNENNRRERIGFILLSLRSAQIIPLPSNDVKLEEIKFKWHRLLGVQHERRSCHPELYLSITIRDHLLNKSTEFIDSLMPFITEITDEEQITSEESLEQVVKASVSLQYLEDGYIRIGPERNATETFCLNIVTKLASNLDLLLPESLVFSETRGKYHITFKIFGVVIKTKSFVKELHETLELDEKIVVRILSNVSTLKEYFEKQVIDIAFTCGNEKLGVTQIELNKVIQDETEEEFLNTFTCKEDCYFQYPSDEMKFPSNCERRPCISVETSIVKSYDKRNEHILENNANKSLKTVVSNIEKSAEKINIEKPVENAAGDQTISKELKLGKLTRVDKKAQSDHILPPEKVGDNRSKSLDTIMTKNVVNSPNYEKLLHVFEHYDCYCLDVTVESILWRKFLKHDKILFKFLHPKSANYNVVMKEFDNCTLGDNISLDLKFRVFYISQDNGVRLLLKTWPPRLMLTDEKERMITEEIDIDTRAFYNNDETRVTYNADIKAIRTFEFLGKLRLKMNLQKLDQYLIRDHDYSDVLVPPVLDEFVILGEMSDLQKWKQVEKEKFLKELRLEGEKEKANYTKQWIGKRDELEEKLNRQVKKCKNLQAQLKKIMNHIRTQTALRKLGSKRSNPQINNLKYGKYSTKELINIITTTEEENIKLKELLAEQRQELDAFQKSALTKEQTANLLQELRILEEKFTEAQTAKQYFKEQWKKACEEIHELKTEDYKQLQNQIQLERQELSQLSLDQFIDKLDGENEFEELYARDGLETKRSLTKV